MPGQVIGGPRRAADQVGQLHQRLRILLQQGQIGATTADRIEKIEAALPGHVGRASGRSGIDQAWPEGVEALAVARWQLQVTAALAEALQPFEHRFRLAKTQRGQALERIVAGHRVIPDSGEWMGSSQIPASGCRPSSGSEKTCSKWRATVARWPSRMSRNPCQSAKPSEAAICRRSSSAPGRRCVWASFTYCRRCSRRRRNS